MHVELETDLYGVETFEHYTLTEALKGFKRVVAKAKEQNKFDTMERTVRLVVRVE